MSEAPGLDPASGHEAVWLAAALGPTATPTLAAVVGSSGPSRSAAVAAGPFPNAEEATLLARLDPAIADQRLGASNTLRRSVTPVLGLAMRGDLPTKLRAFDLGVDDILAMPFSPEELLARSIVISRRASGVDRPIVPTIRLGDIQIDILNREVRTGRSVARLSGIEHNLLYLLASRGGHAVSRDEILNGVWGSGFVAESNIVDRHIRSLRIKLQDDYRHPRFIATVAGLRSVSKCPRGVGGDVSTRLARFHCSGDHSANHPLASRPCRAEQRTSIQMRSNQCADYFYPWRLRASWGEPS